MQKLPDYLTEEEIEKLLDTAKRNYKHWLILRTLYEGGLRSEELCNVKIEHLMPPSKEMPPQIHVVKGKGKKDRYVPISRELYDLLKIYIGNRKSGHIFTNKNGKRLSTAAIRDMVYRYSERAGITRIKVHPHTLRHSRAVYLLKKGMTINELQHFLGHANLETTTIYLKILPKEMLERYRLIMEESK